MRLPFGERKVEAIACAGASTGLFVAPIKLKLSSELPRARLKLQDVKGWGEEDIEDLSHPKSASARRGWFRTWGDHASQWAAIASIAGKNGYAP
jgi:hypothetical protein